MHEGTIEFHYVKGIIATLAPGYFPLNSKAFVSNDCLKAVRLKIPVRTLLQKGTCSQQWKIIEYAWFLNSTSRNLFDDNFIRSWYISHMGGQSLTFQPRRSLVPVE